MSIKKKKNETAATIDFTTHRRLLQNILLNCVPFLIPLLVLFLHNRTHLMEGYGPHHSWYYVLIALLGMVFIFPQPRHIAEVRSYRWLPLALILIPFLPLNAAVGIIVISIAGIFYHIQRPFAHKCAHTALIIGTIWLAASVIDIGFSYSESRISNYGLLAQPLAIVMQLLGYTVESNGSLLYVTTAHGIERILVSPDKFGGSFPLVMITTMLILMYAYGASVKRLGFALLLILFYSMFRTAWLLSAILENGNGAYPWWDESVVVYSYLPLIVFFIPIFKFHTFDKTVITYKTPRIGIAVLTAVSLTISVVAWNWVDPGTRKNGTVLVDEHYSEWELSELPLDTVNYGVKTVYNYYNMMEALGHYYDVKRNFEPITSNTLKDVSVLILKTPTAHYDSNAIEAIRDFVANGGGIWLISDHTNVFGMSGILNELAMDGYGIESHYDAVIDPNANRQLFVQDQLSHPIFRHMPLFVWMTGNSLQSPWGTLDALRTERLLVDNPNFSVNTGFGDFAPQLDERIGSVVQAIAIEHKAGRVAVWSDSTVFSNFGIFLPGKFELALGYVEWLNRRNLAFVSRSILIIISVILIAITIIAFLMQRVSPYMLCSYGWVGASVGCLITGSLYDISYVKPAPLRPFEDVNIIEKDYFTGHLPTITTFSEAEPTHYLTTYIAVQRAGKRPRIAHEIEDISTEGCSVIIHGGHLDWSKSDIDLLISKVKAGAKVCLLDSGSRSEQFIYALEGFSDVSITPYTFTVPEEIIKVARAANEAGKHIEMPEGPVLVTTEGLALGAKRVQYTISGGTPIVSFRDTDGKEQAVVSHIDIGEGSILLSTTVDLFSDITLGENSKVPDDKQMAVLNILYGYFK